MIQVNIRDEHGAIKPLDFDTNAVEVMDGALIVSSMDARDFLAGFAAGQWLTFQKM